MNDLGRVEPWKAHYDEYGRLTAGQTMMPETQRMGSLIIHHHTYEWGPGKTPLETGSHIPGEYVP